MLTIHTTTSGSPSPSPNTSSEAHAPASGSGTPGGTESASDEGVYHGSRRAPSTSSSRAGSRRSRDRSSSDSSSGRSTRQRRADGSSRLSRRGRDREEGRQHSGGSSSSLSPRWDRGGGGTGSGSGGGGISPRRRGEGSPRQQPEPSKVLHVRNVGFPVVQADLVALLSCFGQVEKVKMFSGQALVQLPSVSVAKATMRHYEEDEEPKIGSKRVYLNYSRSRSIETRDGDSLAISVNHGSFNSNSSSNNGAIGNVNGGNSGLDLARVINAARGGGLDVNGGVNPLQDSPSPYAHLIMEDHAKLLGLATCYLQNYGITGGEGAILNINQREEMAERQRQAMAAAFALTGVNGHGHGGITGWNGTAAVAEASRHSRGLSGGGSGGSGMYGARPRSGSHGRPGDGSDRVRR